MSIWRATIQRLEQPRPHPICVWAMANYLLHLHRTQTPYMIEIEFLRYNFKRYMDKIFYIYIYTHSGPNIFLHFSLAVTHLSFIPMDYLPAIGIIASIIFLISKILQICTILIWRPYALTKHFKKQGIVGPPCSILYGSLHEVKKLNMAARQTVLDANSHDITPRVLPHYHKWSSLYGV